MKKPIIILKIVMDKKKKKNGDFRTTRNRKVSTRLTDAMCTYKRWPLGRKVQIFRREIINNRTLRKFPEQSENNRWR